MTVLLLLLLQWMCVLVLPGADRVCVSWTSYLKWLLMLSLSLLLLLPSLGFPCRNPRTQRLRAVSPLALLVDA